MEMLIRVSVCMAVYNGEKYIAEQLASILSEICEDAEIVIVDDCSIDNTVALINKFSDCRIRLFINSKNLGVNKTFQKALELSRGEYIFLADQDDIWLTGRVYRMLRALQERDVLLVTSNYTQFGAAMRPIAIPPLLESASEQHFANIANIFLGRANYYGCAMVFRRKLTRMILPFPAVLESHDLWIAIMANVARSNFHLQEPSLARRIHGDNVSIVSRPLLFRVGSRLGFAYHLFVALFRFFARR